MSNSTYCDDHYEQPGWSKEIKKLEEQIEQLTKERDQAYDYIVDMMRNDPSDLCDVVDEHNPGWCENNCENFNRVCLKKFFEHYKKEEG